MRWPLAAGVAMLTALPLASGCGDTPRAPKPLTQAELIEKVRPSMVRLQGKYGGGFSGGSGVVIPPQAALEPATQLAGPLTPAARQDVFVRSSTAPVFARSSAAPGCTGEWTGTTSQGLPFSVGCAGRQVTMSVTVSACPGTHTYGPFSLPLSGKGPHFRFQDEGLEIPQPPGSAWSDIVSVSGAIDATGVSFDFYADTSEDYPQPCFVSVSGRGRNVPRFTEAEKRLMEVYAKDLAIVAGVSGVVAFGALVAPEPVASKATAIGAAGIAATSALGAAILDRLAADPPDPNFKELARVKPPRVPRIRAKGRLTPMLARRTNALLKNEALAAGVAVALLKSIERAEGAAKAGNTEHDARQMRAARGHAGQLSSLLRRSITLRHRFKVAWEAARLPKIKPSVASIARANKKLANSRFFRNRGVDADSALITARYLRRVPAKAASFPSALTKRSIARSTKKLITGLRAFSEAGPSQPTSAGSEREP